MQENKLQDAIIQARKYNVALRAITYNKEDRRNDWAKNLSQIESEFKVTLNEKDKKDLLKKKDDNKKDLEKKKLHNNVIEQALKNIFQFEKKKKRDGKEVIVPTKDAAELLNDSAELMGLLLKAYGISTSQIRRYLDSLRKIKATSTADTFSPSDVLLQQVKVAYAAGRKSELTFLYEVMKPAITEGSREYHYFEQLLRFVEAIVAYHRFYRGED